MPRKHINWGKIPGTRRVAIGKIVKKELSRKSTSAWKVWENQRGNQKPPIDWREVSWSKKVAIDEILTEELAHKHVKGNPEWTEWGEKGKDQKPLGNKGELTRDDIARELGTSAETLRKARKVCEAAARDPKRFGKFRDEMDKTGKVDGQYNDMKNEEENPS